MGEFLSQHKIEQWILFVASFQNYPDGFSKQDWEDWRPRIARASQLAQDQELKDLAHETVRFFNHRCLIS